MSESNVTPTKREHWSSRSAFIFAAIGSAIGLGNLWRFPRICAENGGTAFLIAYVIALFAIGIPILILELSIGQKMQKATPGSFAGMKKPLEWVGWCIVGVGFFITTYYAVVMGWSLNYFLFAFTGKWGADPQDFFFNKFLELSDASALPGGWGKLSIPILLGAIISWVAIMACIWKGVKTVSKVVYFTVLAPWFILIVFVIRGLTLPGAMNGMEYYLLGQASLGKLLEASTWLAAITQVFFSLSIGFGIMFAYGSFLDPDANIVKNAFIIGISDSITAFVGGLAVFAALGHLSTPAAGGVPINEWMGSSLGICFVAYPTLINNLPLGVFFGPVFFLMLLTLALDSAFSLVEACVSPFEDKFGWSHRKALFIVCFIAFILGVPHIFQSGLYWFDTLDHFMNHFGLAMACLVECIVAGYIYGAKNVRKDLMEDPENRLGVWWDVMIKFVAPIALIFLLGTEIRDRIQAPYNGYPRAVEFWGGWFALILIVCAGVLFGFVLKTKKGRY